MPHQFQNYSQQDIIDFFQGSEDWLNLPQEEISNLVNQINRLARQFDLSQITSVVSRLLELNKEVYLIKSHLDIAALIPTIEQNLYEDARENIADSVNFIKVCADLSYDRDELSWNTELLAQWIRRNVDEFSSEQAFILLLSFSELGYNANDEIFVNPFKGLADKVNANIQTEQFAGFIYSLARANMFAEMHEIIERAKTELVKANSPYTSEIAQALLQADLFHREFNESQGLFADDEITLFSEFCPQSIYSLLKTQKLDIQPSGIIKEINEQEQKNPEEAEVKKIKKRRKKRKNTTKEEIDQATKYENFEEILKEEMAMSGPIQRGSTELEAAINNSNIRAVQNILTGGTIDVNALAPTTGLPFLHHAWDRLFSLRQTTKIRDCLQIIDNLIAAGSKYPETTKISNPRRGREFFEIAIGRKNYNEPVANLTSQEN